MADVLRDGDGPVDRRWRRHLQYRRSTGQAADFLGTTEPKLSEEVRHGRVTPPPEVFAGRRMWGPEHLLQAAENLGLLTDEIREKLSQEAGEVPRG